MKNALTFMKENDIFKNTQVAFSIKSNSELRRATFLFKMISINPIVKIGSSVVNLALKSHIPIKGLIRATVFDHFCGGENEDECMPVINKMYEKGVSSTLDYSVEGKETEDQFDQAKDKVLELIDFSKDHKEAPLAVFKPTGFGRLDLFEMIGKGKTLSKQEQEEWERVVFRFDIVCKRAKTNDVVLLIDAEESWMQDAADDLTREMMQKYNTEKAIIFNTLQMYRHDRINFLKKEHTTAKEKGYFLGYKLVRGAYMEKENLRAKNNGYKTPICPSKEATDINFNNALTYVISNLDEISIFVGTHNEESTILTLQLAKENGIKKNDLRLWFGQLYGMSDHISFNLAKKGFNVTKYLPFGPVKEVMPYLIRRAEENTSVAGQTSRELDLLKTERKRRKQLTT